MPRVEFDHYPTPRWMTQQLIKYADIDEGSIFEPCAGDDLAIAKEFKGHHIITNDLYASRCSWNMDATKGECWDRPQLDWVITNPPFDQQQPIIQKAYEFARVGVAMLLRVTADEMVIGKKAKARADWWADHPEALAIKMPRFSFAKSSKSGKWSVDSAYCQWFVWRKDGHVYPNPVVRLPHDRIEGFTRTPEE